jgi:hypothetical protein
MVDKDVYGITGITCRKDAVNEVARSIAIEKWGTAKVTGSTLFVWEVTIPSKIGPRIRVETDYGVVTRNIKLLDEDVDAEIRRLKLEISEIERQLEENIAKLRRHGIPCEKG